MPWTCNQCKVEITTDTVMACPGCGSAKTSWTLQKDQTRRLRVAAKRFVCERGDGRDPLDDPSAVVYDAATWATTDVAPALPLAEARRLVAAGQGPAPHDVLRVAQHPGKSPPSAVTLTTLPEARRAATTEHAARPDAPHDARFLLVYGGPPGDLAVPGLQVVDVSDDTPVGHAPELEVVALKRPPQRLRVAPREAADDWDVFAFDLDHPAGTDPDAAPEPEPEAAPDDDWDVFAFDLDHTAGTDPDAAAEA